MSRRLDADKLDVLRKLSRDPAWPPQRIADFLGVSRATVYRQIEADAAENRKLQRLAERYEDACA